MTHSNSHPDEVTFREFLLSLSRYVYFFLNHWKSLLVCFAIGVGISFGLSYKKEPVYKAELTFMLSDEGNAQMSGLNSFLGQMGLPISSGKYNIDKLMEISRSRTILQGVLFEKAEVQGSIDWLANHMIKLYDLSVKWSEDNPEMRDFKFTSDNTNRFSDKENRALKSVYLKLAGSGENHSGALIKADYGRDHYIMKFVIETISPELSLAFVNFWYEKVRDFYTEKSSEKQLAVFKIIEAKRDSIREQLTNIEYRLARIKDSSLGSFGNQSALEEAQLSTQSLVLRTALMKSEENLALAEFTLENETPLIQLIDTPLPPLQPSRLSITRTALIGFLMGFFIFLFFVIVLFLIREGLQMDTNS